MCGEWCNILLIYILTRCNASIARSCGGDVVNVGL